MMYRKILQVCFHNATLHVTSDGLTFTVFWDRAGKPWNGSSGGWTQRSRSWRPQHVGPYEPPWLQRSLRNDTTYLFIPAEPARKCISQPPASLYDALVLSWCTDIFCIIVYYSWAILNHLSDHQASNIKGFRGCSNESAREGVGTFMDKAALPVHNGNM